MTPASHPSPLLTLLLLCAGWLACLVPAVRAQPTMLWPGARPAATFSLEDHAFLEELSRASFQYFVEQSHPVTGLVRDRARADGTPTPGMASIAASGFAFTAWTIATDRGWVLRSEAVARVRQMLRFLVEEAPRAHGFFYHFMDMETGERAWECELSSIDTALCLAGAIVAREYFNDPEINALVDELYGDANWQWFLNGGLTVALGWKPETGFSRYRWNQYSEHMLISLLGLGAPRYPLPDGHWSAWLREPVGTYAGYSYLQSPPLFTHQFTHAYADFRGRRDAYADYYHNSVLATLAQQRMCIDLRDEFPAWSERLWGVTASDYPGGYVAWGGPPRTFQESALDGTVVPCAAAGSLPFAPEETLLTLRHMRTVYGDRIWGRYGFADAFNPHTGWVATDNLGIDVGITLMQAENARTGLVWALFMQAPEIQRAFQRAGFLSTGRQLTWDEQQWLRDLARQAWRSLADEPLAPETAGLQITAVLAAQAAGLLNVEAAVQRASELIARADPPREPVPLAQYAAALATIGQAYPRLAPDTRHALAMIDWRNVRIGSPLQLGSGSRLAVFFQIASGVRPVSAWYDLKREPEARENLYVLAPGRVDAQFLPGIWLDERHIVTGASASQLAYTLVGEERAAAEAGQTRSVLSTALLLDKFPREVVSDLRRAPPADNWIDRAAPGERAALLITAADVLVPDCVREWFQRDPMVQTGRRVIPEFAEAAFSSRTSVVARRELAGPLHVPPERVLVAISSAEPVDRWEWHVMTGLEFKESTADVRPEDPVLEMRFAFAWDATALYFHAIVQDVPEGEARPPHRRERVELFVDPRRDGLVWDSPEDFQFSYRSDGHTLEWFHQLPAPARVVRTPRGYEIQATIDWARLGLEPRPGLELAVSPAVLFAGPTEVDPVLKLNWRFFRRHDERFELATLRLE